MRKALIATGFIFVAALAALLDCKSGRAAGMSWKDTFSITVPVTSTDIKQGQSALVRVVVNRDEGFKQSIRLEVRAPVGLDVDPNTVTLRLDERESDVPLRIMADNNARTGAYKILVIATPDIGSVVEAEFQVNVIAK